VDGQVIEEIINWKISVMKLLWSNSAYAVCVPGTRHTHRRLKITLPNTDYAHEKYHE